jgi:AraC family transcriptional regulator of adaptative response/methylated-DNA-[protein]-cysteine methyltransferase
MTEIIHYTFRDTSLGLVAMAATAKGICFVEFGDDRSGLLAKLASAFPSAAFQVASVTAMPELETWISALAGHLNTGADLRDLPVDIRGTDFEIMVWSALRAIPEGDILTYSQLAGRVGRPSAVRAVASACGRNRISVLIPCHRVLRGNGELGGYRWGLDRKQALLQTERNRVAGSRVSATAV